MATENKNFRIKNTLVTGAGSNNEIIYPITDGSSGQVLTTDGSGNLSFADVAGGGGISDIVEDTTPQLGGNLDTNGNSIGPATQFQAFNLTSYNGDITIDPAYASTTIKGVINTGTTQRVSITLDNGITLDSGTTAPGGSNGTVIDGLTYPSTDGANGQVLTTDGSGNLSFANASGGGISNIVEDTTPQLGGNLDVNDKLIYNDTGTVKLRAGSADYVTIVNSSGDDKVRFSDIGGVAGLGSFHQFGEANGAAGIVQIMGSTNGFITGSGALRIFDNDSSAHVQLTVPATVSANVTFTLPGADGSNGQVMTTDGSGNLSFADMSETTTTLTADSVNQKLVFTDETGTPNDVDLSWAVDDTNLARLTSGTVDANTGVATFTRDDATDFTVDFSALFDDTNLTRITSGTVSGNDLTLTRSDATTVVVDVTSLNGLSNVAEDTTPQLGGDLDAQFNNIINVQSIAIEANNTSSDTSTLSWNAVDGTLDLEYSNGVALQVGQETHVYAKASGAISNGEVVMFAGVQGDHLLVAKADITGATFKPEYILGVATHDILNNEFGYITTFGKVRGIDTSLLGAGSILYADADTAGGLTTDIPTYPTPIIQVAAVVSSNPAEGVLMVRPSVLSYNDVYGDFNLYQDTETFTVAVDTKDASHPQFNNGSANGYKINGTFAPFLHMVPGMTYRFDQSDASNSGHPLVFYYDENKTTSYTDGVTNNGTPGSAGAYTQIIVSNTTPSILYYQCSAHALMGWGLNVSSHNNTGLTTDTLDEGSTNLYYTDSRVNTYINNNIDTDDVSEGATNLYFNQTRARQSISADANSTITYSNTTGVISIDDSSYLTSETYSTASELLTAIKTVDGASSGLEADLLDGQEGSYYLNYSNLSNTPTSILNFGITDGTAGQVLQTDGSGNFSFTTVSGGGGGGVGYTGFEDYFFNVSSQTSTFGTSSGAHDKVQVFVNGAYLDDSDFTFNANTGIVSLTTAAENGDEVSVWGFNSTGLSNHELFTVDGSGNIEAPGTIQIGNHRKEGSLTSTIASISPTDVLLYLVDDYVGAKLIITVKDNVTGDTQISEALILTDPDQVAHQITTYGTMYTSTNALATFDAGIYASYVPLTVTMASSNSSTVKVAYTLIDA